MEFPICAHIETCSVLLLLKFLQMQLHGSRMPACLRVDADRRSYLGTGPHVPGILRLSKYGNLGLNAAVRSALHQMTSQIVSIFLNAFSFCPILRLDLSQHTMTKRASSAAAAFPDDEDSRGEPHNERYDRNDGLESYLHHDVMLRKSQIFPVLA